MDWLTGAEYLTVGLLTGSCKSTSESENEVPVWGMFSIHCTDKRGLPVGSTDIYTWVWWLSQGVLPTWWCFSPAFPGGLRYQGSVEWSREKESFGPQSSGKYICCCSYFSWVLLLNSISEEYMNHLSPLFLLLHPQR